MNYTELISKFWNANEKHPLGASAIALYLFLLEEYRKNEGKDFSVSNDYISQKLSLTRPTVNALKAKLRNVGLIQYQVKNGLPSIYRIVSDFSFLQQEPKKDPKPIPPPSPPKEDIKVSDVVNEEPTVPTESIKEELKIPSLEEFMNYAKTIEIYDESMDFQLKAKYKTWVDNGWKNGIGMPIIEWKNNLNNTIPYLKKQKNSKTNFIKIPTIKRPKTTYNE